MAPAFEQRDLQQRLSVDLEQVECREDPPAARRARHGVPLRVHLELRLVEEAVDQHSIQDRAVRARVGDDGVVELARTVIRAVVAHVPRAGCVHPDEDADALPLGFEDVAVGLRLLADVAGTLRRQVRPDGVLQVPRDRVSQTLDRQNGRSNMRTPVPNASRGSP